MGRRSYGGEKRRKELQRKAKREAKQERRQQGRGENEAGGGPPIDWEAQVGGTVPAGDAGVAEDRDDVDDAENGEDTEGSEDREGEASAGSDELTRGTTPRDP